MTTLALVKCQLVSTAVVIALQTVSIVISLNMRRLALKVMALDQKHRALSSDVLKAQQDVIQKMTAQIEYQEHRIMALEGRGPQPPHRPGVN